jgi:S-DNA-T family DNA segregation ATPase FtsK/SpoIIIE
MKGKPQKGRQASVSQKTLPNVVRKRLVEGGVIFVATIALFTFLALLSYHLSDPGWSQVTTAVNIENAGGRVGAYLADALYFLFGYSAYALPICLVFLAWVILKENRVSSAVDSMVLGFRALGFTLFFLGIGGLLSLNISPNAFYGHFSAGGWIGKAVANGLSRAVNVQGATLLCCAIFLVGMTFATHVSWLRILEIVGDVTTKTAACASRTLLAMFKRIKSPSFSARNDELPMAVSVKPVKPRVVRSASKPLTTATQASFVDLIESDSTPIESVEQVEPPKIKVVGGLPTLKLLEKGQPGKPMGGYTHQELELLSREVEQHLRDFGVMADVVAVHPGPVITRFELQLAAGVKVSKLSALSIDLARSLSVKSVRVVEIIPGKTVVGIELPNMNRATVSLSDVLSSEAYQQAHSPLSMALGVDIAGHPMIVDLGKMPHLLVAGTTGSGKSVGINAMILSLLFKATPEQVRLIMIDPKMLELSVYDGIPHLLTPVVTDMKEAASALRWCVGEMERRYRLMSALGVRNLAGFNTKLAEACASGTPLTDPLWKPTQGMATEAPLLESLPYVVVVIDELADMMMVVGKKVEQLIARIAQKARAAGIHLILATQRPSVDVLTGLIKSNIPTRISFQVSSKIDSRTILDQQGAEQLLGHGDMLFLAPGTGAPLRVHGAFVDDREVHRVADDWRARGRPDYIDEITQSTEAGIDGETDEESTESSDPIYDQAVEFVIQSRKASVSSVQRRFKIGYNRAARLVEEMERTGLVGPLDGGSRDVLVSSVAEE